MKKNNWHLIINAVSIVVILTGLIFTYQTPVRAATTLSITPITWNVIGLDSNNVAVGPNAFPVGARVCNTGGVASGALTANFVWDDGLGNSTPYINLSDGTLDILINDPIPSTNPDTCVDFFFEVEVTRSSSSYNKTRRYHITVTEAGVGGATASTPTPRELYVEKLVSQSRNGQLNLELSDDGTNFDSFNPGETLTLMVGETYFVRLTASTATNGYEQIESYLSLPNVYFQVLSVTTDYSVGDDTDLLYGDACTWENNPYSLNYRSCLATGKAGGSVITTYEVNIIQYRSGDPTPVYGMIYDFSGSSYHYNSDYMSDARDFYNFDPATLAFTKTFVPDAITPGGTSQLVFSIPNPSSLEIGGVKFTDTFPTGVTIFNTTTSAVGCGSPTLTAPIGDVTAPIFNAGVGSFSASNITLAPNGTCTIKINVTAPITNSPYTNTTDPLYINDTTNTGVVASDILTVADNVVACTNGTMAQWVVPNNTVNPPDLTGGSPTTKAGNLPTATVAASLTARTAFEPGYNSTYSWEVWGYKNANQTVTFTLDAKNYLDVSLSFYVLASSANSPTSMTVAYSTNGTTWNTIATYTPSTTWTSQTTSTFTPSTTGNTLVRITGTGGQNDAQDAAIMFDNMTFTGCSVKPPPTLSKSFGTDPIFVNGTSNLTFTLSNNQTAPASINLTNVAFRDVLPTGLKIAGTPTNNCGGTLTAATGTTLIELSGFSMAAASTCTIIVPVLGAAAGYYENVSGYISSTESGENKTSTGYGMDSILVLGPPYIEKSFGDEIILTGSTSILTFMIRNPNPTTVLSGVAFTDTLPIGLTVTASSSSQCGGTLTTTVPQTISLSGGSIAAYGNCTFSVTVTGATAGSYTNTTGAITSTNGGTGNTATDTLVVRNVLPRLALLKQVATSALGPWYSFLTDVPIGSTVYYRITIENTGDVPLTDTLVVDNQVSLSSCSWTNPLPVAVPENENHITTCIVSATVAAGVLKNTATASGTYNSIPYSASDDAWYSTPGNYGHLPYSDYDLMNLFLEGGARHLTDSSVTGAYLGSTVPEEVDGSSSDAYGNEVTDDGVEFTGTWVYGVNGGSMNITVYCPSGTCTLAGWIDWNEDGDFGDESENVVLASNVTSGTNPYTFTIPGAANLVNALIYSRFRLYASAPGAVAPSGEAKTSGGTATVGEVEDYEIVMKGGDPTAITLPEGLVCTVDSAIHINWVTTNEMEILSFRLYRSVGLEDARSLIYQKAAVFSGKLLGTTYSFTDLEPIKNTRYYYWLEVVGVDGSSTVMAPATAGLFEFKIMLPIIQN